eukprot:TRINITY_DN38152_c0_g1_i1.p1 TRINITY_DN38152_c0_g1~~TRINITY_DN38152_c0_g1_i1.p1  ORF type:complete len:479 (+),score=105.82 TRINITY_DN38152_c0_g1_i1:43-1479(+)
MPGKLRSAHINPVRLFKKATGKRVWERYADAAEIDEVAVDFEKVKWEAGVRRAYEHGEVNEAKGPDWKNVRFGFEVDCISDEPMTRAGIAEMLTGMGGNQNPFGAHGPHALTKTIFHPCGYSDRTKNGWWKIKPDYLFLNSKPGEKTMSFQLVSPVLSTSNPAQAYFTISTVCNLLKQAGFRTDPCGGLHVHIDASELTMHQLRCAVWNFLRYDRGMGLLIPKDRLMFPFEGLLSPNPQEPSILDSNNIMDLVAAVNPGGPMGRFRRMNLTNFLLDEPFRQETIEIRSHHAVLDPLAVMSWARLCEAVVNEGIEKAMLDPGSVEFAEFRELPKNFHLKRLKEILPDDLKEYYTYRRAAVRHLHETYDRNRVSHIAQSGTGLVAAGESLPTVFDTSSVRKTLETTLLVPSQSGLLTYRHGPLSKVAPRSAMMRELFPITEQGDLLRSTDSDVVLDNETAYVPGDPMDPMLSVSGGAGEI